MADLKLRNILDRWTSCSITLEDAERELTDLLIAAHATQVIEARHVSAIVGRVEILHDTDPGGKCFVLVDGREVPNLMAVTLQLRMRQQPLLAIELRP